MYSVCLIPFFQFYIASISIHALFLSVNQTITCVKHEWKDCSVYSPPATVVLLLFLVFEALLFAIFTVIMLAAQMQAIWNDETVTILIECDFCRMFIVLCHICS